jgi:predicted Fe-Mo cluster-binding NifX family protein
MKAALTVRDGRISPVFDVCRRALLLELREGNVVANWVIALDRMDILKKADYLLQLGVRTLVCGAISEPALSELRGRGIRVVGFVAGEVEVVLEALLAGKLPSASLSMPGCCGFSHGSERTARRRVRWSLAGRRAAQRRGGL